MVYFLDLIQTLYIFIENCNSRNEKSTFYGSRSSRPNLWFLQSAKDAVDSSSSHELEIFLLTPDSGDKALKNDEDGDENELDED